MTRILLILILLCSCAKGEPVGMVESGQVKWVCSKAAYDSYLALHLHAWRDHPITVEQLERSVTTLELETRVWCANEDLAVCLREWKRACVEVR